MFKIINKQILAKEIKRLDIEAADIARDVQPGQFVMIAAEEDSRWIPLTVADADVRRGMISVIFKEAGAATHALGSLPIGERLFSVSGPFGKIRKPKQVGVVVCAAEGVCAAQILPICRAYNRAGNKVIGVFGARAKDELILEPQMRIACHAVFITTEDGSYQRRGRAEDVLKEVLDREAVRLVYSAGSVEMMRAADALARDRGITSLIQVHTLMSCGRGLCGSCRIKAGGHTVLACEDGPEFDGSEVDFDYLKRRMEPPCERDDSGGSTPVEKTVSTIKRFFE